MVLTLGISVLYDLTTNRTFALHDFKKDWFCITAVESVYSVVRTESLHKTDTFSLKRVNVTV